MGSKLFPFWWLRVPFTCDDVRACLEGDFSSWTVKWIQAYTDDEYGYFELVRVDETLDKVWVRGVYLGTMTVRKLSDGSVDTATFDTLLLDLYYNRIYSLLRMV